VLTRLDSRLIRAALFVLAIAAAYFVATVLLGTPVHAETVEPDVAVSTGSGLTGTRIIQQIINGTVFGILLALASVGLSLIYGTTGLSNFAHGEQVTLGAVLCYFFATPQPVSFPLIPADLHFGFPLWLAALLAIVIAGGTGWLQDRFLWNPLRRRRVGALQQMIVSIGLALALLNFLQWWVGVQRYRLTVSIDTRFTFGNFYIGRQTLLSVIIALMVLVAVSLFLLKTRLGRATRAISDNPALASASGIRVDGIIRLVWVLATALAALGGVLLALYENGFGFDSGGRLLLLMFAAVTLGGLGQAFGALVGSLVIGLVTEVSTLFVPPDLKYASALAILILVLLVRPQGILGRAERVG
jgi:branched-subunit amino acid ABC-type transport system permease component